ncbi:MAG TPA: TetR family transcriptional regulator [Thermomicrobiales bacterium]|nr:TetR family transcriptional regulator [Thermomicrobiales bacterium]
MTTDSVATRKRDAAATQQALLDAATDLFGAKGYEKTTLREIAERAGVDAALIARYFGNKAALYVAVLGSDTIDYTGTTLDESVRELASLHLRRTDSAGVGPITQALLSPDTQTEIRAAAADRFQRRLISRLTSQMTPGQGNDPQLLAEVAMSALMGVMVMRSRGGFYRLLSAPADELERIVAEMILTVLGSPQPSPGSEGS